MEPTTTVDDFDDQLPSEAEVVEAIKKIRDKCAASGFDFEELADEDTGPYIQVSVPCGREARMYSYTHDDWALINLSKMDFGKVRLLTKYDGIFSIENGTIEIAVEQIASHIPAPIVYRRLFKIDRSAPADKRENSWTMESGIKGQPKLAIGTPTPELAQFVRGARPAISLKLFGCKNLTDEYATTIAKKLADSLFFQIDVMTGVSLSLSRIRAKARSPRELAIFSTSNLDFVYPTQQYDDAPLSLYSYARSARNMPLLQFLAYYQVLEYYYPVHSAGAAHAQLRNIIKDPTFRVDNDAAISKLLTAVRVSSSGAFGDERTQLRATLRACTSSDDIRGFISAEKERVAFFGLKASKNKYGTIPVGESSADLIDATAERVYAIRCRIVHTKADARDGEVELLLPFTPEAESMGMDIELMQFLSWQVLIAGSKTLNLSN